MTLVTVSRHHLVSYPHIFSLIAVFYACGYFEASTFNTYSTNSFIMSIDLEGAIKYMRFFAIDANSPKGEGLACTYPNDGYVRSVMTAGSGYIYLTNFVALTLTTNITYTFTDTTRLITLHSINTNTDSGTLPMVIVFQNNTVSSYTDLFITCHLSTSDNYFIQQLICYNCGIVYKFHA